jgi:hypothetical protein
MPKGAAKTGTPRQSGARRRRRHQPLRTIHYNREIARLRATLDTLRSHDRFHVGRRPIIPGCGGKVVAVVLRLRSLDHAILRSTGGQRYCSTLTTMRWWRLALRPAFSTRTSMRNSCAEQSSGIGRRPVPDRGSSRGSHRQNDRPPNLFEHFEALAHEWEWEMRHENRLRRQGRNEEDIARVTIWFRRHPRQRKPFYVPPVR